MRIYVKIMSGGAHFGEQKLILSLWCTYVYSSLLSPLLYHCNRGRIDDLTM